MPGQTVGRFDLHDRPPVRYLAETAPHAIGEVLAPFRGTRFRDAYLRQAGQHLALVEVVLSPALDRRLLDCTDPAQLAALGIRPDELAHHDRRVTQRIARHLYQHRRGRQRAAGFRWWSALTGAWHTLVVFTDRARPGEVTFGAPHPLTPADPDLVVSLGLLGVRV